MRWPYSEYSVRITFNDNSYELFCVDAPRRHEARLWALEDRAKLKEKYAGLWEYQIKRLQIKLLRYKNKRIKNKLPHKFTDKELLYLKAKLSA